ncbi:MAG: homoserine dehydrogenase [Armatimonadetes bacterium]|nr:homoserine dehydrogenase [Armatimonadota bacterium]
MEIPQVKIGILGFGVVGGGLYHLLSKNADEITQRTGLRLVVARVADLDWQRERPAYPPSETRTTDAMEVINDPEVSIVVETIGGVGTALELVRAALAAGKSVVTSNKELIAKYGAELFDLAAEQGVDLLFEGAVGGTIPIIRALKESLEANHIDLVLGIVNGTTNYILTRMSEERSDFRSTLAEAQRLGYAEADPTDDVEGYDARNKLAILCALAFGLRAHVEDIYTEGITGITPTDLQYSEQMGYVVKLLALGRRHNGRVELRVHPTLLPETHPLASVRGSFNAIFVHGDGCDDVMLYGRGAGDLPTGSAVAGDVIEAARNVVHGSRGRVLCTCVADADVVPMEQVRTSTYLRLKVTDRPGVLGRIATAFGEEQVSLASVIQLDTDGHTAEIVMVTHACPEGRLNQALARIEALDEVEAVASRLRVMDTTSQP